MVRRPMLLTLAWAACSAGVCLLGRCLAVCAAVFTWDHRLNTQRAVGNRKSTHTTHTHTHTHTKTAIVAYGGRHDLVERIPALLQLNVLCVVPGIRSGVSGSTA